MSGLVALLFGLLAVLTSASKCPTVEVVKPICTEALNGTWYQMSGFNTDAYAPFGKCQKATYINKGTNFTVKNEDILDIVGIPRSIDGYLVPANSSSNEGKFNVTLKVPIVGYRTSQLSVLGFNCKDLLFLWSCTNIFNVISVQAAWMLSTNRSLSWEELKETETVKTWLKTANVPGLTVNSFKPNVQKGCTN